MKKALITGVTGQDGAYLSEFLLGKGYTVYGVKRRVSLFHSHRIDHLYQDPHQPSPSFILHYGASTSELYGKVQEVPRRESTPLLPRSPYAAAKLFGYAAKGGGILANATYPADFIRENLLIETQEESLLSGPLEPTNRPYAIAKIAGWSCVGPTTASTERAIWPSCPSTSTARGTTTISRPHMSSRRRRRGLKKKTSRATGGRVIVRTL